MNFEHLLQIVSEDISSKTKIINSFIREYLIESYGEYSEKTILKDRHGGCFEFADAFQAKYEDAEMWETIEMYDDKYKSYPLVISYKLMGKILEENNETTTGEVGWHGHHAVVKWNDIVFDIAGISSFEQITKDFNMSVEDDNVHWIQTQ